MLAFLLVLIPAAASSITAIITYQRTKELRNGGQNTPATMHDKIDKLYRIVAADERADDETPVITVDKKGTSDGTEKA